MDKAQALHQFWSSFGIDAYDENTVPDNAEMPYITYSVEDGSIDDPLLLNASIWYRSTSWKEVTKKSEEIAKYIGEFGHLVIKLDKGYVFITKGVPFAQRMPDPNDSMIRRIYLIINTEFLTAY